MCNSSVLRARLEDGMRLYSYGYDFRDPIHLICSNSWKTRGRVADDVDLQKIAHPMAKQAHERLAELVETLWGMD